MKSSSSLGCGARSTSPGVNHKLTYSFHKLYMFKVIEGLRQPSNRVKAMVSTENFYNVGLGNSTTLQWPLPIVLVNQKRNRRLMVAAAFKELSYSNGDSCAGDDLELKNTRKLVESAMFAAAAGLVYFLSNLFRLEAYFGYLLPLPIVISSLRWGAVAGGKTMVATVLLLFILSGPIKAISYLLMHGLVGVAMGAFWRWGLDWGVSLAACTLVRSIGIMGFISLSSWLLRENILALIIANVHASFSYILAAFGANVVPAMQIVFVIFACLVLVDCGSFVFLVHVLYAICLRRLGIEMTILLPPWIERALHGRFQP